MQVVVAGGLKGFIHLCLVVRLPGLQIRFGALSSTWHALLCSAQIYIYISQQGFVMTVRGPDRCAGSVAQDADTATLLCRS